MHMSNAAYSPLNEIQILIPFRGTRNYVHSASLINHMVAYTGQTGHITFRFSRMACSNELRIVFYSESFGKPQGAVFDAWWRRVDGRSMMAAFIETGKVVPEACENYIEESAISGWQITESCALLGADCGVGFTLADRLIALNKAYLNTILSPARYLATRLELRGPLPPLAELRLAHIHTIGRVHHISRVWIDGAEAGILYFARQAT
jgi:hypothetical protein